MPFKILFLFLLCVLLCTCSDDNNNPTYPFERTVLDVSIVKKCKDGSFEPGANCYLLRWRHPIERKDLQSYYIWIGTTFVNDSTQNITQTEMDMASKVISYDPLIRADLDSVNLTDLLSDFLERDSVHIAIWAKYSGNHGAVQHLYAFFGDDIRPSIVNISDSSSTYIIWINWTRPTDQRDFYFPDIMNGPIAGYNITIQDTADYDLSDVPITVRLAGSIIDNSKIKKFHQFKKDGRKTVLASDAKTTSLKLAVIDGEGFIPYNPESNNTEANNWRLEVGGLRAERSYSVSITAYDSAGNSSGARSIRVRTTDLNPPTIPGNPGNPDDHSGFWFYKDPGDGLARLDSNRLVLFWLRSVDQIDGSYSYREVEGYSIEQRIDGAWEPLQPRNSAIKSNSLFTRYRLENGSMVANTSGEYVSDTLRWVAPGDFIQLRIRARDNSGHYSKEREINIEVSKGKLLETKCPVNFMPVENESESFCMEKLQHATGNDFVRNVLYVEAKKTCENLSNTIGFEGFTVSLCSEQEWNAACNSRGSAYGVIEETEESLPASELLFRYCGVATGDSVSAKFVNRRNRLCTSPDGIRDLPGQLQEWVTGDDGKSLLKGGSYALFGGVSRLELALCKNRFTPTRIRPRYTTNKVYLYKTGSRIDTTFTKEEETAYRKLYAVLPDNYPFTDTLLFYSLYSSSGEALGEDYVNQAEYRRRGGNAWLNVLWQGLKYEGPRPRQVFIFGTESIDASNIFLDQTVGFRCCAK